MGRPGKLGNFNWIVSGSSLSGTVNASAGNVLAWFKGEVSEGRLRGTFTAVTGQGGTWEWEGPVPESISPAR